MRVSILDFGSNTFHCVVADMAQDWKVLAHKRIFVQLGSGISEIMPDAFERGLDAIKELKEFNQYHEVQKTYGFATEAIRKASNGIEFITDVLSIYPMELKLIDGQTEAWLISMGVRKAIPNIDERAMIMDIGGGSVEFIIIENNEQTKAFSYPIGILNLKKMFQHSDPMTEEQQENIWQYLTVITQPLAEYLHSNPAYHLIGSSGTFDVLVSLLKGADYIKKVVALPFAETRELVSKFQFYSTKQMYAYPGIMEKRVPFLAVASSLIFFVMDKFKIQKVTVSPYAMKEGVLEVLHQGGDIPYIKVF